MKPDSVTEKFLVVLGIAKCALVLAFFASFAMLDPRHAQADNVPVCSGSNIVEKMQSESPDVYDKVSAEAAKVLNGENNFWKVEKAGYPVSYLFGTMHMADPEIAQPGNKVTGLIDESDRLVIEAVDALDPVASQQAMAGLGHLTLLKEGTLRDLVRDDLEDELEASLSKRGMPIALADRMQPWLIATLISVPVCEMKRKQAGGKVLDSELAAYAKSKGMEVDGLETVAEQLTAIASLPQEYHVSSLEETLANDVKVEDMIATLKYLYLEERMGMVIPLMKELAPVGFSGEGAAQFQEALITVRNRTMLKRVLPMLESDNNFVAVGALHLPGEEGLVNLLRQEGFDLTPVR